MTATNRRGKEGSVPYIVQPQFNSIRTSFPRPSRQNNFSTALLRENDELAKIHVRDS